MGTNYSVQFAVEITVLTLEKAQAIAQYLEGERTIQDLEALDRIIVDAVQDGSISYGPGAVIWMHRISIGKSLGKLPDSGRPSA